MYFTIYMLCGRVFWVDVTYSISALTLPCRLCKQNQERVECVKKHHSV